MNERYNPIIDCLWKSSHCACKIASLLPKTDITEELFDVLIEQLELIDGIIDQDLFLISELEQYSEKCEKIIRQINLLELKSKK